MGNKQTAEGDNKKAKDAPSPKHAVSAAPVPAQSSIAPRVVTPPPRGIPPGKRIQPPPSRSRSSIDDDPLADEETQRLIAKQQARKLARKQSQSIDAKAIPSPSHNPPASSAVQARVPPLPEDHTAAAAVLAPPAPSQAASSPSLPVPTTVTEPAPVVEAHEAPKEVEEPTPASASAQVEHLSEAPKGIDEPALMLTDAHVDQFLAAEKQPEEHQPEPVVIAPAEAPANPPSDPFEVVSVAVSEATATAAAPSSSDETGIPESQKVVEPEVSVAPTPVARSVTPAIETSSLPSHEESEAVTLAAELAECNQTRKREAQAARDQQLAEARLQPFALVGVPAVGPSRDPDPLSGLSAAAVRAQCVLEASSISADGRDGKAS